MATHWRCPCCGATHPRGPVLSIPGRDSIPCPACRQEVDLERLGRGAFDCGGPVEVRAPPVEVASAPPGATCPFCGRSPGGPGLSARVLLVRGRGRVAPRQTVEVPRCDACRRAHGRVVLVMNLLGAAFGAVGIAVAWRLARDVPAGFSWGRALLWGAFGFLVAGGAGMAVGRVLWAVLAPRGVGSERSKYRDPRVVALTEQGWTIVEDA